MQEAVQPPPIVASPAREHTVGRIIPAYKAKQKLSLGTYLFNRERLANGKIYWQCENRDCSSRVHTYEGGDDVQPITPHNHPGTPGKAEAEYENQKRSKDREHHLPGKIWGTKQT